MSLTSRAKVDVGTATGAVTGIGLALAASQFEVPVLMAVGAGVVVCSVITHGVMSRIEDGKKDEEHQSLVITTK